MPRVDGGASRRRHDLAGLHQRVIQVLEQIVDADFRVQARLRHLEQRVRVHAPQKENRAVAHGVMAALAGYVRDQSDEIARLRAALATSATQQDE